MPHEGKGHKIHIHSGIYYELFNGKGKQLKYVLYFIKYSELWSMFCQINHYIYRVFFNKLEKPKFHLKDLDLKHTLDINSDKLLLCFILNEGVKL